jgi:hypothetical protein
MYGRRPRARKKNLTFPRIVRVQWRHLAERIAGVSAEIEALAKQDASCQRLMSVPGVGPIVSSAVVAAIGNGSGFKQGRDFAAWPLKRGIVSLLHGMTPTGGSHGNQHRTVRVHPATLRCCDAFAATHLGGTAGRCSGQSSSP